MQSTFDFAKEDAPQAARILTTWPPQMQSSQSDWSPMWQAFASSVVGQQLIARIAQRIHEGARIYPPEPLRIFSSLPLHAIRVVILGQDPYHGPGQAEGLAFSVPDGVKLPPSLRNIFKEVQREFSGAMPRSGHLERWVTQGVFLLNTALTVEEGLPASHAQWGWDVWTDQVISAIAVREQAVVFMLWGAHAQAKRQLIEAADVTSRHLIVQANHPSPLSASRGPSPFVGCGHFSAANAFLQKNAQNPIDW